MKRPIILLSLFNVLFRASSNILWLALLTLLLKSAGVQALPWLYTISNLLLISIFYFFKGTLRKRIGQPLLSLTTRILVLASLVGSFMLDTENSLVFLVTLIILVQSDEICGLSFAKTVSEHLNLKEAKRWQPVIFAAGSVGLCISGLMLKILLDIISLKELLWCTSILFLLVDVILSRLKKTTGSKEDVSVPKPDSVPVDQPTHVSPFSHPLVRLLIFSIIFRVVTKFPVDFLYSDQINRHFTSTKDLAAFMGMFSASIDLVVIVIQTLVAGWAFSNFPVGKILLILPITMSTLCLVSIFHTSFILTVSLQFSLLILARALNNPGNYILLGAVPKNKRTDYFRSIFLAKTISTLTAGTILIFAKDYFSPVYFYMVLAVINVIFLCITFGIDSAYFKTLKLTIRDTRGTGDPDMIESLKFVAVKDRIPEFKTLLRHSDSSVRLKTVEEVSLMDSETIQELLLPVLEVETDSRCLTAMANLLVDRTGHTFLDRIEKILHQDDSPRLTANILELLGKIGWHERVEQILAEFLTHMHHRIRGCAIISLLRIGRSKQVLLNSLSGLAGMARSEIAIMRGSAAAVMGELALPMFVPALESLSLDGEKIAARNAMIALAKIKTPKAVAILENRCQDQSPERSKFARQMFQEVSCENVKRLGSLLANLTSRERKYLLKTLKKTKEKGPLKLLAKIISIQNEGARARLTIIMQHSDAIGQAFLDRCLIEKQDGGVEPTIDPIIQSFRSADADSPFAAWGKIVRALAFLDREKIRDECSEMLVYLWQGAVALEKNIVVSDESWKIRREIFNYLLAYSTLDSKGVSEALKRAQHSDIFDRSIAHEFLESSFDKDFVSRLIPILYHDGKVSFSELGLKLTVFGSDGISDETLTEVWQS